MIAWVVRQKNIPTSSILLFSSPVLGVFMAAMLNFYLLKFSTDVLLIAPATVSSC